MKESSGEIEFSDVSKHFGDIEALNAISFAIAPGELVFITGPSGSGKTTLLKLLIREILPTTGTIVFDGLDVPKIRRRDVPLLRQKIGSVFQDFRLLPERTISENVAVPLAVKGVPRDEWESRVEHVLKLVGVEDRMNLFPSQLSGGEQQRAVLARALVINPMVIFADEPTGNLDWETASGVANLLAKINEEGKTVIIATHNKELVDKYGKRVIKLNKGKMEKSTKAKSKKEKKEEA